jgi:N-methylhydantoinase A
MEKALRVISVERGYDPRDFSLISFGGAGGLHAADLARALRLARVFVPENPGGFSALGVLLSNIVKDVSQSVLLPVPDVANAPLSAKLKSRGPESPRHKSTEFQGFLQSLDREFARLERAARIELHREQFPAESARAERHLDVRYVGQSYELSVPFSKNFPGQFHREHEKAHGHAQPGRPLEVVNLRVRLTIRTPKPRSRAAGARRGAPLSKPLKRKAVWFGRRFRPTPFYDRERLSAGASLKGPAVVVEYSSTTVVPPDFICHVDEHLNLVLSQQGR